MKTTALACAFTFIATIAMADGISSRLNITEVDGSPSTYPWQAKFSNGSVTDNGDGTVTITSGGSGGSSALGVNYNGVSITSPTAQINFVGPGVSLSATGSTATVTISSWSGGSGSATLPLPGGASNYWQYPSSGTFAAGYGISASTFTAGTVTVTGNISGNTESLTSTFSADGTVNSNSYYSVNGSQFVSDGGNGVLGNTFLGKNTGASTTVFSNTCVGNAACRLLSSGGNFNTCIGAASCPALTSGGSNSVFGDEVATALTTGSFNSIFGSGAGIHITTGTNNAIFGYAAGETLIGGTQNAIFGDNAGNDLRSGNGNTCIGTEPCHNILYGSSNTMVGFRAGDITEGVSDSGNTFLGYKAGPGGGSTSVSESICLGVNCAVTVSNTAVIGGLGADAVNVIVDSLTLRTGGVRFADGTNQTTAATSGGGGGSGYAVQPATVTFQLTQGATVSILLVTSSATIQSLTEGTSTFATQTTSGTIIPNAYLANTFIIPLASIVTINGPTNPRDTQAITFRIQQDATTRVVTWATGAGNFSYGSDIPAINLSNGGSKYDYVKAIYNSAANRWNVVSVIRGF